MAQDHRLLTIQDISCVGQCSLTVALPIISACGIEAGISYNSGHFLRGTVLAHCCPSNYQRVRN